MRYACLLFLLIFLSGCNNSSIPKDIDEPNSNQPQTINKKVDSPTINQKPVQSVRPIQDFPQAISTPEKPVEPPVVNEPVSQPDFALIDSVQVQILESYPVQYSVLVNGNFRNGCEKISDINQVINGTQIELIISTLSDSELMCTQALVPFTQNIALNTSSLTKGKYTLKVNQAYTEFEVQ